jgi:hypothetical protein
MGVEQSLTDLTRRFKALSAPAAASLTKAKAKAKGAANKPRK